MVTDAARMGRNEHKRWQMPPAPRVSVRAFGQGWRMPLAGRHDWRDWAKSTRLVMAPWLQPCSSCPELPSWATNTTRSSSTNSPPYRPASASPDGWGSWSGCVPLRST